MLETLDERRKKRNEERERKRHEDPSGDVFEDEPDDITPFLVHPDKDNGAQEHGQCSKTTPVPNQPSTPQPKGEARSTQTKATPKFNVEGTLFHDAEASQNEFETYDTSIPNDITLLAACDIAPPLPLFTTEALERIRNRKSLKFVKVGTGRYENTRVLYVSDFPADEDLPLLGVWLTTPFSTGCQREHKAKSLKDGRCTTMPWLTIHSFKLTSRHMFPSTTRSALVSLPTVLSSPTLPIIVGATPLLTRRSRFPLKLSLITRPHKTTLHATAVTNLMMSRPGPFVPFRNLSSPRCVSDVGGKMATELHLVMHPHLVGRSGIGCHLQKW
ncbi:hypothetical protein L208DRAFT_711228 [Tricholoma matsutake]|nr:hypothetical protein L208DRAFT_711228 [Tricholoma matsutake 945]